MVLVHGLSETLGPWREYGHETGSRSPHLLVVSVPAFPCFPVAQFHVYLLQVMYLTFFKDVDHKG